MKPRFYKSLVRDLALAIGLPAVLIALLLACAAESAPPMAAAPARGDLWPAWTSTDPVTTVVGENYQQWVIEPYSVTVTFYRSAVSSASVFTFAPKADLKLPSPLLSTAYMFEIYGTYLDSGEIVSLGKAIDYELLYQESRLGEVPEQSLILHYVQNGRWYEWPVTIDTAANRITWKTQWTGQFGFGGHGPLNFVYLPTAFNGSSARSAQTGSRPMD